MNPGTVGLARGLAVLVALSSPEAARDGLGVNQLTEAVGGDKSQLSRVLATLAEQGFVERDPETLAYRLGRRIFAMATSVAEDRLLTLAPGDCCAGSSPSSARARTSRCGRAARC